MKVLHIFNEIKFSGAEIMYANAASLFQQNGIEMVALSTGKEIGDFLEHFEIEGIKVYHKPLLNGTRNPITLFRYFYSVIKFIRIQKIDLLHIHRAPYYSFFALAGYIAGVKVVRTIHNVFKNRKITRPKAIIDRLIARKIYGVKFQTIGESVYDHELKYFKNPTLRVNNWYDGQKFYPAINQTEKEDIKKKLNIPLDSYVIISTGACSSIKNHHDIIKALVEVNRKLHCTYLHLGTGVTENEEEEMAKQLGVFDRIMFLGNKSNVREFLVVSDAFIMTSRFEGLSIASIEAMACSIPSILYNSPGLRDLIKVENNGYLIEANPEILAEKIIFLAQNPEIAEEKGSNARKFVLQNFSIERGVKEIINFCYN